MKDREGRRERGREKTRKREGGRGWKRRRKRWRRTGGELLETTKRYYLISDL